MNKIEDKIIASSDYGYLLVNWIVVFFFLISISIGSIVLFEDLSNSTRWILGFMAIAISIYIPSYLYLYKVIFFLNKIEVSYQVQYRNKRNKTITLNSIRAIRYSYTGGRGSGGMGILKIYFTNEGHKETLKCPMDKSDAAKYCSQMREIGVAVEIKPTWILNEYY